VIGAEDVPGMEAVTYGDKVDTKKLEPGIVQLCKDALIDHPNTKAFLFECTELPPYSNAVRLATGKPVFDAVTSCNLFIASRSYNDRCNPHAEDCTRVSLSKQLSVDPYDICQQNTADSDSMIEHTQESSFNGISGHQIFDNYDDILDNSPTKLPSEHEEEEIEK
jgi:hypothetical protein